MKIIGRTLAILAAALLIVGATVAIVQNTASASLAPGRAEFRQPPANLSAEDAGGASFAGARPPRGADHGAGGSSLFGLLEVAKNLGIIAVIVAVVAGAGSLLRSGRQRSQRPAESAGAPQ